MRNGLIKKIDRKLSEFFGMEKEGVHPQMVQIISNKIIVTNTLSYKRHAIKESWENFSTFSIKNVAKIENGKLGLALGKAIAKNLIVTFDETKIKEISQ